MNSLDGKRVAFTGKLASMTRAEAAALVKSRGGKFVSSVTPQTSLLVIGQEGWPLQKDGTLSRKLQSAQDLQAAGNPVEILIEEDFLGRLGAEQASLGVHKRFTVAQLGRLLQVPRDRLRSWMRAGLLEPVETIQGVAYFDFQQVTAVRTLWDLVRGGVTVERLRRSLEQLSRWLPKSESTPVNLMKVGDRILLRLEEGQLVEPSGQLHFDFEERGAVATPLEDGADWFQRGCDFEDAGKPHDAIRAYRAAVYHGGPDPKICFNLGNVLYGVGQLGQAAERFRQAIELEHDFAEAWNNLGNVLLELGEKDEAMEAFATCLRLQPDYSDAHYNLADALDQAERFSEAHRHWKEFLRLEPMGDWADYARKRLGKAPLGKL